MNRSDLHKVVFFAIVSVFTFACFFFLILLEIDSILP